MLKIPCLTAKRRPRQLTKAHHDDAGFDLCALDAAHLDSGDRLLVPTGLRMAIPEGYVGLVCPRSGLALKKGVTVLNAPGVIDAGYRGDVGVVLINLGLDPVFIDEGDAVAQLLIIELAHSIFLPATELPPSARDEAGYGSTGA